MPEIYPAARGLLMAAALAAPITAAAQTPPDFYRGKNIDLYVWSSPGGAYDSYARALARHIGRFIPGNPTLTPRTMEGAGGLRLANFLYNAAPRDGLVFGTVSRGNAFDPLLGNAAAQFDATKFNWIGSANNEVSACVAWRASGVASIEDARSRELVVGASGPAADTTQFPKVANALLGTRFKIVGGYPGGNEIDLAMERGEVQGRCGWSWTSVKGLHQPWLDERRINVLFQMGLSKHPDLPDTPLILDLARDEETRAILKLIFARQVMAWPFVAPPGIPAERAATLRKAFAETLRDPAFAADATKQGLEITLVSGGEIEALVREAHAAPAAVTRRAAELLR